jgi:hypothetical protein
VDPNLGLESPVEITIGKRKTYGVLFAKNQDLELSGVGDFALPPFEQMALEGWGTADSSSKCNRCDFSRPVLYEVESAFG